MSYLIEKKGNILFDISLLKYVNNVNEPYYKIQNCLMILKAKKKIKLNPYNDRRAFQNINLKTFLDNATRDLLLYFIPNAALFVEVRTGFLHSVAMVVDLLSMITISSLHPNCFN